jgi:beta-glucanase (GH16 family)
MRHRYRLTTAAVVTLLSLPLAACTGPETGDRQSTSAPDNQAPVSPPEETGPVPGSAGGPPMPVGRDQGWRLAFSDEFDGPSLDRGRWADTSSAEPDQGRGNLANQQLEWNQAENCQVSEGHLVMIAKREKTTSPSGTTYDWTSCLITSTPSHTFQFGYLEERSILPAERGFWPAFWTWQAKGVDHHTETDVYEYYSDNKRRLYATQYSGQQGRCDWKPDFDPTADFHTYGVAIEPSGTTWYADGKEVCRTDAAADAPTNIISNLAVYAKIPPEDSTTSAVKRVDYIRAWEAG